MGHHRADARASRSPRSATPSGGPYPGTHAGRRVASATPAPARRGASSGKRSAGRKSLFRGLPSAPIVLGIAAMAVSVGGAVSAADPQLLGAAGHSSPAKVMQASAVSGAGGVASTSLLDSRGPVVSRDSRRDAQSDAAGVDLVAAAEAQN